MQPELFALAVAAVIFAGISKGGFGSGASFASAAILALALPPAAAEALPSVLRFTAINAAAARPSLVANRHSHEAGFCIHSQTTFEVEPTIAA